MELGGARAGTVRGYIPYLLLVESSLGHTAPDAPLKSLSEILKNNAHRLKVGTMQGLAAGFWEP